MAATTLSRPERRLHRESGQVLTLTEDASESEERVTTTERSASKVSASGDGGTVGVYGYVQSPAGIAVLGCGHQYGVAGYASDHQHGYAVLAMGNLKCEGKAVINTIEPPRAEPADADIPVGCLTFTVDEQQDKLRIKVKFSDGSLRWGIVPLTPVRP